MPLASPGRLFLALLVVFTLVAPLMAVDFVRAEGKEFRVGNRLLRFVGFNMRGICHYGRGDILPLSQESDISTNLNYCNEQNAKVIRFVAPYWKLNQVQTGDRLQVILDACNLWRVHAIVCLTDVYEVTQLYPQGDGPYYTDGCCGLKVLNHQWYAGGYQTNYLPQVLYLANRFKDHPAIFAWQLGNEIRDPGNGPTFQAFAHNVAAQIRSVDPNHMISLGVISAGSTDVTDPLALYTHFDFVGTHNYNGGGANDWLVADILNKPYVIDEAGFDSDVYGPDRTPESNADMNKWFNTFGVSGYMNWGLMATPYNNGDGDFDFGIDHVQNGHSSDYDKYKTLFRSWGELLCKPLLRAAPATFERTVTLGGSLPPEQFELENTGGEAISFQIFEASVWADVSIYNGQLPPGKTPITVTYNTTTLPVGVHESTMEVHASAASNSPLILRFKVTVVAQPGDFDGDNDVDQADYGFFQTCLTGPGIPIANPACEPANLDGDQDVDQADRLLFEGCMSGSNVPADPDCVN